MSLNNKIEKTDLARNALYEKVNTIAEELDSKKQDLLVSGTNIKSINGESIIGSGNILIDGMQNKITNCITEIPQDIKLELNNGTLKLKAGSKVYVPNGFESDGVTHKFDEIVSNNDITYFPPADDGTYFIYFTANGNGIINFLTTKSVSGSTDSLAGTTHHVWYDTTLNKVHRRDSETTSGYLSLPICIFTSSGRTITSIDQVFNGFGYIGSTVFALPGVKGLIPNGRNEDGSLKNIEFTVSYVNIHTQQSSQDYANIYLSSNTLYSSNLRTYNEKSNYIYNNSGVIESVADIGFLTRTNTSPYNITSFKPKSTFRAVDYNDKSTIAGWSMPSGRYVDLTLGDSGSAYTAPANGWFSVSKSITTNQYINIVNINSGLSTAANPAGSNVNCRLFLPVVKNDVVAISYNASGTTNSFRFIYAEGENS